MSLRVVDCGGTVTMPEEFKAVAQGEAADCALVIR